MPWLTLSLRCRADRQPAVEQALESLGALALTLLDADADTPNERAVLEPGVGETPLWNEVVVQALFPHDADRGELLLALVAALPGLAPDAFALDEVADRDWERAWMDQYQPMRFGQRLAIYPWTIEPPDDASLVVVRLDPGLAFGSGTHPTTALCLEWLDRHAADAPSLLDYGCGSGVLAIAGLKLGAEHAVGIDNDPQALLASADNAARNDVGDRLQLHLPGQEPDARHPLVVANILANALETLAPRLAAATSPGGRIALSGILCGQHDALLAIYADWFDQLQVTTRGDWLRIDGVRRPDA